MDENEKKQGEIKQTKKELLLEILRFLVVGGLATAIDWAICFIVEKVLPEWVLGNWHIEKSVATTCGFVVGLIVNYVLSLIFVYKHKKDENEGKSLKDFIVFTIIGVFTLGVSYLGIYLLSDLWFPNFSFNIGSIVITSYIIARVIMTAIGLVINYIGRKIFIFK